MSSVPLSPPSSPPARPLLVRNHSSTGRVLGSPLSLRPHDEVARQYLRGLRDAVRSPTGRLSTTSDAGEGSVTVRAISREDLPSSVCSRLLSTELRALRPSTDEPSHVGAVDVLLPLGETLISAGRDGRALASRLVDGEWMSEQVQTSYERPLHSSGWMAEPSSPVGSEPVTAGASLDERFVLGRRDGAIFRGTVRTNAEGERMIGRRWSVHEHQGISPGWQLFPDSPRLSRVSRQPEEDPDSRRIAGLALLRNPQNGPPALIAACGKLLWNLSMGGGVPHATSLDDLLREDSPHHPERIQSLSALGASAGSTRSSLFAMSRSHLVWLTAKVVSAPFELRYAGQQVLTEPHTVADWQSSTDGPRGLLGRARSDSVTFMQWDPSGDAYTEQWHAHADPDKRGGVLALKHMGQQLYATGHTTPYVRLWDERSGRTELDLELPSGHVTSLATHHDEMALFAAVADDAEADASPAGVTLLAWDIRHTRSPSSASPATPAGAVELPSPESQEELFGLEG